MLQVNELFDNELFFLKGLVGAVFEGIGVSVGSLIGGFLMESVGGSMTFRYFSYAAGCCFAAHVLVQALLNKITGTAYGKKTYDEENKTTERVEINAVEYKSSDEGDEFKDVDLTRI